MIFARPIRCANAVSADGGGGCSDAHVCASKNCVLDELETTASFGGNARRWAGDTVASLAAVDARRFCAYPIGGQCCRRQQPWPARSLFAVASRDQKIRLRNRKVAGLYRRLYTSAHCLVLACLFSQLHYSCKLPRYAFVDLPNNPCLTYIARHSCIWRSLQPPLQSASIPSNHFCTYKYLRLIFVHTGLVGIRSPGRIFTDRLTNIKTNSAERSVIPFPCLSSCLLL